MGNNQSQNIKSKLKKKDDLIFLFNNNKKQNVFSKLSLKTLSLLTSFLSIQEYYNILLTSKETYQLFIQTSGCFQIECHRLLNINDNLMISQNWKKIIQSLLFIPIKALPFRESIKSVRQELKQIPILLEHKVAYSGFQKAILYFQNNSTFDNQVLQYKEYQESKQFAIQNQDLVLKVRQGLDVYIQLPSILMQVYNLHDYIKIYSLYLEIKFCKCNLQQFIQLWNHYKSWISVLEQDTNNIIAQFNYIINAAFPLQRLPIYTVRQFMVSQWLKKSDRGEIIVMLREEFRLKMIESRNKNIKFQELRDYVQYLIEISTNQINIHQYGYYNFEYCQEINTLVHLAVDLSPLLTINYQSDESMLIYIFGQYIYNYQIFELLFKFRIEQFKQQIKIHQQASQKLNQILVQKVEDQQSLHNNNLFDNQIQEFNYHLSMQYDVELKIRSLFKQISYSNDDICTISDNKQTESLQASKISLASTNCSSFFQSFIINDELYHYIKFNQQELFNQIQLFYQRGIAISYYQQEIEPENNNIYDIPELGYYYELTFTQLMQLFSNKNQRSNSIQYSKRQISISIFDQQLNQHKINTKQLSQTEQLLINILK
ncbi:unnamed protein product [Paramecium primaurelia]|uniref:Uncharacterized protein n=1 Tax=Paramecium primaurelia TaxID=5886 RepID=A0A8S1JN33_PARPR|nr:unnamed protein product [Paramecium primaurelia]